MIFDDYRLIIVQRHCHSAELLSFGWQSFDAPFIIYHLSCNVFRGLVRKRRRRRKRRQPRSLACSFFNAPFTEVQPETANMNNITKWVPIYIVYLFCCCCCCCASMAGQSVCLIDCWVHTQFPFSFVLGFPLSRGFTLMSIKDQFTLSKCLLLLPSVVSFGTRSFSLLFGSVELPFSRFQSQSLSLSHSIRSTLSVVCLWLIAAVAHRLRKRKRAINLKRAWP